MAEKEQQATQAGLQGAISGAMLGATLAGPTGGLSVPVGATLGAIGLGGAMFGFGMAGKRKQAPQFDINAVLAKINAQIEAAGELAKQRIRSQMGRKRRGVAANLAARGVYRAPVSENVFGELRREAQEAELGVEQSVLEQQAGAARSLFFQGAQLQSQQQRADIEAANRRRAAMFGQLGAISSAILQNRLQAGRTTGTKADTLGTPSMSERGRLLNDPMDLKMDFDFSQPEFQAQSKSSFFPWSR